MSSPLPIPFSLNRISTDTHPRLFSSTDQLATAIGEIRGSGKWISFYEEFLYSLFTAVNQLKTQHSLEQRDLLFHGSQHFGRLRLWEEGGWRSEEEFVESHTEWYEDILFAWNDHVRRCLSKKQIDNLFVTMLYLLPLEPIPQLVLQDDTAIHPCGGTDAGVEIAHGLGAPAENLSSRSRRRAQQRLAIDAIPAPSHATRIYHLFYCGTRSQRSAGL